MGGHVVNDPNNYIQESLGKYLDDLAARKIAPGGGSASALAGAIGASLNLMVINFTLDREGSGDEELVTVKDRQQKILTELKSLIDEDCRVFRALMKSFSSGTVPESSYIEAAIVPLKICRLCHSSMELSSLIMRKGNMKLVTDVGGGARILRGAFFSAKLNVDINLSEIKDRKFITSTTEEIDSMANDINHIETAIRVRVKEQMNGKV